VNPNLGGDARHERKHDPGTLTFVLTDLMKGWSRLIKGWKEWRIL